MASDESNDAAASGGANADPDRPQGVFGNLPQTRPGARSPRRERAGEARVKRAAAKPKRAAPPPRATPAAEQQPASASQPQAGEQGSGIEDVAWAGVAAAAEAATIGVRLATRALEAMRDAVDRR